MARFRWFFIVVCLAITGVPAHATTPDPCGKEASTAAFDATVREFFGVSLDDVLTHTLRFQSGEQNLAVSMMDLGDPGVLYKAFLAGDDAQFAASTAQVCQGLNQDPANVIAVSVRGSRPDGMLLSNILTAPALAKKIADSPGDVVVITVDGFEVLVPHISNRFAHDYMQQLSDKGLQPGPFRELLKRLGKKAVILNHIGTSAGEGAFIAGIMIAKRSQFSYCYADRPAVSWAQPQ